MTAPDSFTLTPLEVAQMEGSDLRNLVASQATQLDAVRVELAEQREAFASMSRAADNWSGQYREAMSRLELVRQYRDESVQELAAFKILVAEVGERYAVDHSFCGVYDEMMEELGLQRPNKVWRVTMDVTVSFDVTYNNSRSRTDDETRNFLRGSTGYTRIASAIDPAEILDHDWCDGDNLDVRSYEITEIERSER